MRRPARIAVRRIRERAARTAHSDQKPEQDRSAENPPWILRSLVAKVEAPLDLADGLLQPVLQQLQLIHQVGAGLLQLYAGGIDLIVGRVAFGHENNLLRRKSPTSVTVLLPATSSMPPITT